MPMDYNIAVPQFNVAPAQGGGPVNMLTDVMKLKGLQQDQQLNQLKFQEYQRARADAATARAEKDANEKALLNAMRNASVGVTGPQMPDMSAAANALIGQGKLAPALTALGASEAFTKDLKAKSDLAKVDTENLDKQLSTFRTFAGGVNSPESAGIYAQAMYDHPTIGKLMAQTGYSKEAAVAKAQQDFASDPQRWVAGHVGLTGQQIVDSLKQTTANTDLGGQILQQQRDAFGRPIEGGETRLAKTLTPKEAAAGGMAEIPKLKPGERYNPETKTIEAIPGSDIFIAQSQKHEKDAKAVQGVARKTDEATTTIDTILSDKNKDAFASNFGGYSAYATRLQSGDVARVRNLLTTMASNLKAAGLEEFRTGGSIGAMTEREWPIVEKQIASLSPEMSVDDARDVVTDVKRRLTRMRDDAKEMYTDTWGQTQYVKQPKGTPAGNGLDSNNPLLK